MSEGTSRSSLSLPVMEHIAPHLIAVLNGYSLTHLPEKFQKFFSDSRDAFENRNIRASADFSDFLIAEIVESMEQKPLPLLLGAESQHRKNFPAGFHAANILLWRFAIGQTALGDNYVLVIATLVPMVFPLTVKTPVKLFRYHPNFVKGSGIVIGQIAPMLSDGNCHSAFSFRSKFCWD
jgi:hypothetical protein